MKQKTIGIILITISAFFILGSVMTLMKTREKFSEELKETYLRQGISLSDTEVFILSDKTYMTMKISSSIFLILFIWIGYKGYTKCKTKKIELLD